MWNERQYPNLGNFYDDTLPLSSDRPNLSIVRNQPNRTFQPFFVRNYRTEPNITKLVLILPYFHLELIHTLEKN